MNKHDNPPADLSCVGYFEGASAEPTHWPPPEASCPVCGEPLGERHPQNWKFRDIAPCGGNRSYFIAYHAIHSQEQMDKHEADLVDAIFAWDDAIGSAQ
jgi:hypothetical protein